MAKINWWIGVSLMGATLAGFGQEPTPAALEVAAINQVLYTDQTRSEVLSGSKRPGMTVTDARVSISYMSLAELLRRAFRVEPYQLSGPEWLDELRFDIQATIPLGSTRDQVPAMLQTLLAQRFGLTMHRESREVPAYLLVVGKDGPKFREVEPEAVALAPLTGDVERPQRADTTTKSSGFAMTMKTETGGTMTFKAGANGTIQTEISRMTMNELAQNLTGIVGRPVIDRTGLTRPYQLTLEVATTEIAQMMNLTGGPGANPSGGNALTGAAPANSASEPRGQSSVVASVEKLGLKLDPRRMPVEVIIVDKISRIPTPN